jgi:chemotaxis methyl-accepting protein methylase
MNVTDYVAQLDSDPTALQDLINHVTVQETAFFRDQAQFDALASSVLPALEPPVTVWSAACANGQEAYSVAMVLQELGHRGSRIMATDISTHAIERTRRARYSRSEIKGLSDQRRDQYLTATNDGFEIVPELRTRVDVKYHNLATDALPFAAGTCPVVLCRNVLIYFSQEEVMRFLDRLADGMAPGGWLFLGYSETLWQVSERFELVRVGDAFLYRRVAASCTDRAALPAPEKQPRNRGKSGSARMLEKQPVPRRRGSSAAPVARPPRREAASRADVAEILASGAGAVQAGDHGAAVTAFRKYAYLYPGEPIAHLHLGLALEASGDATAANRAYAAARVALDGSEAASVEATLEGYRVDELARLLDMKLAAR